jgi:ElaB/YqjD/DUF883 family membrane-anchored ribosome-binding protein
MADEKSMKTEVDAIREDIQKLQNDLKDMFHSVGEQGKEKLQERKQQLENAIKSLQGRAAEIYESFREHGQDAVKKSQKQIEARPLTAVFIAFAAGILTDRLIRRMWL